MIYSDGQLIFAFSKLRERALQAHHSEESTVPRDSSSGVHATNSQILGFLMIALANTMSILFLHDWFGNLLMLAFWVMSVAEHCVLESGKTHSAVPWTKLATFPASLLSKRGAAAYKSLALKEKSLSEDLEAPNSEEAVFDFSKNSTKLVYAGAKFCVALCLATIYIFLFKVMFTLPYTKTQGKSIVLLSILVLLSIYRDKHEKKIASTYDPSSLHIGRAMLTPLVYISFTVLSLIDQSLVSFLTATAYQLGYL